MKKNKNNYAFIDSQNLNLAIRDCGWNLDFARFRIYLRDKYNVFKAFLFIGYVHGNERLYASLRNNGYIVIFKPTLEYKHEQEVVIKGNVDAELVLHTMIEYQNYDKAIIISGDGDFHCLIEYLEENKKLKYVVIPNRRRFSALLRRFRPFFVYIDNLQHKLGHKKTA